jgi:hypothetical protein
LIEDFSVTGISGSSGGIGSTAEYSKKIEAKYEMILQRKN